MHRVTYWQKKTKHHVSNRCPSRCLHLHMLTIQMEVSIWGQPVTSVIYWLFLERASDSVMPSSLFRMSAHAWALQKGHGTNARTEQKGPQLTPGLATPHCGFALLACPHDTSGMRCYNLFQHFMHLSLSYFFFPCCRREHMLLAACINEPLMPLLN